MNLSDWIKAAALVTQQKQEAATPDTDQLSSMPLSQLAMDDSGPPVVHYGMHMPAATSTPTHTEVNTYSPQQEDSCQQIIPGIPQGSLYPTLASLSSEERTLSEETQILHNKVSKGLEKYLQDAEQCRALEVNYFDDNTTGQNEEPNPEDAELKHHHHKHKTINTIMRILATITIMRIIEVNPEAVDPIEAKIQDVPLEAKISLVEVKETRKHTKANIKMMAIKAIITRVIEDFIIIHVEIFLKVIAMDNLEAEAMAEAEAIMAAVVAVGPIIEAMLIINIISIMVMMMSTRQTNTVHHVLYAVAIITLPNIVLKESTTSMTLWKRCILMAINHSPLKGSMMTPMNSPNNKI